MKLGTIRKSFDRIADRYDHHAALEQEVCKRLIERTEFRRHDPARILDLGCATGSGIDDQHAEFSQPLLVAGYDLPTTFYFGESVLLPAYRGKGTGHAFFDAREAHAIAHGYKRACFCAVERPDDHPKRPAGYTPLDAFWQAREYRRLPGVTAHFTWPETAGGSEINHPMAYWLRQF